MQKVKTEIKLFSHFASMKNMVLSSIDTKFVVVKVNLNPE